jgi:hypothetical protein
MASFATVLARSLLSLPQHIPLLPSSLHARLYRLPFSIIFVRSPLYYSPIH